MARYILWSVLTSVVMLTGCRTSEANYRAAYEQAVAGREEESGIDRTVYDRIRQEAVVSARVVENGDTVAVRCERVKLVDTDGGVRLQDAYVVVAQFKQLFNARSLCGRLRDSGYPEAVLLSTREPLYYVAISGGTVSDMAVECRRYAAAPAAPVKEPYPLVLEPAGR
ncbi:MAG: hypothetical protein K2I52_06005 [Muribaculaceae bacterium]|nr:hypothetical protein [Muribaculaceae bacterium]